MGATVTKDWTVAEITAHYPQVSEVFAEWGIHCFGCSVGGMETLAEAGALHGFSEDDLERLVEDLNDAIAETPSPVLSEARRSEATCRVEARPEVLHVTKSAALQVRAIAKEDPTSPKASRGKGVGLSVLANPDGSFFMEFRDAPAPGEKAFINDEADDVRVYASPLTLRRIGGATIDFREGRFKLEVRGGKGR